MNNMDMEKQRKEIRDHILAVERMLQSHQGTTSRDGTDISGRMQDVAGYVEEQQKVPDESHRLQENKALNSSAVTSKTNIISTSHAKWSLGCQGFVQPTSEVPILATQNPKNRLTLKHQREEIFERISAVEEMLQKAGVSSSENETRKTTVNKGEPYQLSCFLREQHKATLVVQDINPENPRKRQRFSESTIDILNTILKQLDKRYVNKCRQSEAFPPRIDINIKKQCIRDFQKDISEDRLPIQACGVCAQLTSDVNSRVLPETSSLLNIIKDDNGKLVIYEKGRVSNGYRVCDTCYRRISGGHIPKAAVINGFDLGSNSEMPNYLRNLTEVEEMLIAKSRPFGKVRKLGKPFNSSINYRHIGGHVIVVPEEVSTVYTVLPPKVKNLADTMKVIWVGKNQPKYMDLKPYLEVRREVVRQALLGLKRDNPVYKDVQVDEELLNGWAESFIPKELINSMTVIDDVEGEGEEREGYVTVSDEAEEDVAEEGVNEFEGMDIGGASEFIGEHPRGGSVVSNVNGSSGVVGAELAYLIGNSIRKGQEIPESQEQEQYIRYIHSGRPLSDYDNVEYFLGSFPTLFWNGRGSHLEGRKIKVSYEKWVKYLLNHHSRRFARHPWFMYLAFNIHVRRLSAGSASLVTNRKSWPKIRENLASLRSTDFELAAMEMRNGQKVSNKKVWAVVNSIEAIGNNIPLSNQQRNIMKRNAFGMIIWNGQPAIWLTLNPNEVGNPLCCIIAGVSIPMNMPTKLRKHLRQTVATNDPVSAARFFKIIVDAFIQNIIRIGDSKGGIFGPCDSYFATVEASGRGALHLHCLVWIAGNVALQELSDKMSKDEEFSALVISYLEEIIVQSLNAMNDIGDGPLLERTIDPDSAEFQTNLEIDSNLIAARFNQHKHTFTCRKYKSGERSCRFGAPWKLVEKSFRDEEGNINLKRNDPYINKWNPVIASVLRCNHDVKFIPGERGFLGLVYYITDYATKISKPLYHTFSIAAGLAPARHEEHDQRVDEEENSKKLRQFLVRLFNRISVEKEISGPEIGNVMIEQPEFYTNVKFRTMSYNSLYAEMVEMFPHLRTDTSDQDQYHSTTVSILDSRTVTDRFTDYKYRGFALENLCLYDYSSVIYTTPLTSGSEKITSESWVQFSDGHPLRERLAQRIYQSVKDCRVVAFSGQKPLAGSEEQGAEERCIPYP